jgi:GNAT superfamily N-acetyltransferase
MMMEPRQVAALEEKRVAVAVAEGVEQTLAWCGGVLAFNGVGSWSNQGLGCCMEGQAATAADVAAMIDWFESRAVEPKIVVAPFADPSLVRELGAAGFRLRDFETVFARPLADPIDHDWPHPRGVTLDVLDPRDDPAIDRCVRVIAGAFTKEAPSEVMLESAGRMARHPRMILVVARENGRIVGGAHLEVNGQIAGICGAGVLESHRRRGIQRALLDLRLDIARRRGAIVATVTTMPGIPTERNAMRCGFTPSYTKVALVRPGPGLTPSP